MRIETIYIAFDGTLFDEEWKCLKYEERQKKLPKAREAIKTLRNYCRIGACSSCPFFTENNCYFKLCVPGGWRV